MDVVVVSYFEYAGFPRVRLGRIFHAFPRAWARLASWLASDITFFFFFFIIGVWGGTKLRVITIMLYAL